MLASQSIVFHVKKIRLDSILFGAAETSIYQSDCSSNNYAIFEKFPINQSVSSFVFSENSTVLISDNHNEVLLLRELSTFFVT